MENIEHLTLIEKFVKVIPLPYSWAALVWTIVLGPPGSILIQDIDSHAISFIFDFPHLYNSVSLFLTLFYLFVVSRYLRLRIMRAEREISPIMQCGEREFHAAFRWLTNPVPVIILSLPFLTPIPSAVPWSPISVTLSVLAQFVVIAFGLGNFVWDYSVSNWGLHKLGKSELRLRSFLSDRMMGCKPIGNAALSATISYLGGILLLFLLGTSNANLSGLPFYLVVASLLVLGVVMFFLPLNSIHLKMVSEKARNQLELNREFMSMTKTLEDSSNSSPDITKRDPVERLLRLKEFEIKERKLATTPSWPFDVQVLARLITIVLSVTAVLLSRFITDYLIKI